MAHVLVVEDNPVNMKLAAFLLQTAGHDVLCAVSAELALALARAHRPDLILMDCQLPVMDGLSATVLLKNDPATAAIPVVALTALVLPSAALDPASRLFDAFISKPLRYQELFAVVNTLLEKKPRQQSQINQDPGAVAVQAPALTAPNAGVRADTQALAGVVDIRVLEALVGRNPAVIRGFLLEFQSSATAIGLLLEAACSARQAVVVGHLAHKLKSAAYAVGAVALGDQCAAMEAAGKSADIQLVATLWPLFTLELKAVNAFVATFLALGSPKP